MRRSARRLVWYSAPSARPSASSERRVHAHQHLPSRTASPFLHQDFLHHALLGRLHDLEIAGGHQLAVRHRDDVEPAQRRPQEKGTDQPEQQRTARPRPSGAGGRLCTCSRPGWKSTGSASAAQSGFAGCFRIRPRAQADAAIDLQAARHDGAR